MSDGEPGLEGGTLREFQIVGVVRSLGLGKFDRPRPQVYFSLAQRGHSPVGRLLSPGFGLFVRTAAPPAWLYRTLHVHAPELAVMNVVSMRDVVETLFSEQRSNAWYFSALASLGVAGAPCRARRPVALSARGVASYSGDSQLSTSRPAIDRS